MPVKDKIKESLGAFAGPIKGLREALGMTQEQAVRRIGLTLGAWRSWESGLKQPRRQQIEKIANLADDPAIRMKFWLDIYDEGIKLGASSQKPMTPRETLFVRYVNDIVMAAKELCLAAAAGSTASEEMLKHAADDLIRRAGDARRTRESTAQNSGKPSGR